MFFRKLVQVQSCIFRYFLKRSIGTTKDNEVIFHYVNKTGIIQLNKPTTLNALTYSMIKQIHSKMKEWQSDEKTKLIIIKSSGSKAFSAGGDIKILSMTSSSGEHIRTNYLRDEYQLIFLIGILHIPYVALINGITMGGGCGVSVHGSFRIATEMTTVAMPETAIGLFPNAGGSYFLSRLPNNLGVFLGLTGHRLHGIDVVHAGIATHFVPARQLPEIQQNLIHLSNVNYDSVKEILDRNSHSIAIQSSFSLHEYLPFINRVFSVDVKDVETIFEYLQSDGSPFALKQLSVLRKRSPTSLKVTLEQLKRGQRLSLKECLKMEYRTLQYMMKDHDFYEGVRAVLLAKDNNPQWKPNSLETISNESINKYFQRLPDHRELELFEETN